MTRIVPVAARVKICGLTRRADAEAAAAAGADYLGVVLAPGGARSVALGDVRILLEGLPGRHVGVFVNASAAQMRHAAEALPLDVIQLHGDETPDAAAALRDGSGAAIWKAVRPRDSAEFLDAIARFSGAADALLLDGWNAQARGGSGTPFPWDVVAAFRGEVPAGMALVIAGGLRTDNVADAVHRLRPDVVDVSSGVEDAPGRKNSLQIHSFVSTARAARSTQD